MFTIINFIKIISRKCVSEPGVAVSTDVVRDALIGCIVGVVGRQDLSVLTRGDVQPQVREPRVEP
jgi:hypothetical protein